MSVRRMVCKGFGPRPCPVHAWWYAERREGRPVERCEFCRPLQRRWKKTEHGRNHDEKRRALYASAIEGA